MRWIKWALLAALALAVLVATSCVPRKSTPTIIPGERVGPIFIGQSMVDARDIIVRLAGPVNIVSSGHGFASVKDPGGFAVWDWITPGVTGATPGETPGQVLLIAVYEDSIKLADGLGVGSNPQAFHDKYGVPPVYEVLAPGVYWSAWPEQGLAIIVEGADEPDEPKVVAVVVFPRVETK